MLVNSIVILLILFFGFHFSRRENRDSDYIRKRYIIIICTILILQSGLRNVAVGADTFSYYLYFQDIKNTSWETIIQNFSDAYVSGEGKDPGYHFFEKIVSFFTDEYQILLIVIAIIFFSSLGNFIYKNTSKLNDAIIAFTIYSVLFYSFFSITGHRQTIATAFALYGFEYIKKRKLFLFIILITIGFTVHKSLLVFAPFYFLSRIKHSNYFNWLIIILLPFFMMYRNSISNYFKVLGGYEEYDIYEGAGTYTFTAMFLIITIIALIKSKLIFKNNPNAFYFYNAFALALLFVPLTWVNPSAMRVVQYFSIYMLLLIPEIINSLGYVSVRFKRGVNVIVILTLIILMIKANINAAPYGFFWDEMSLQKNYM